MAFNINDFRATGLIEAGARPSLFEVSFPNIPGSTGDANDLQRITTLCQSASLPASIVDVVEVPYFGRRIKFNGERVFQDWTVTIMNDEDFTVRELFETWSNMINLHVGNTYDGDPHNLTGYKQDEVQVRQYGKAGEVIRSYLFYGLWPKTVSDIRVDWGLTNQMEVFEVQFAVDFWIPWVGSEYNVDPDGILGTRSAPPGGVADNIG